MKKLKDALKADEELKEHYLILKEEKIDLLNHIKNLKVENEKISSNLNFEG